MISRDNLFVAFFFAVFFLLIYQFYLFLSPFVAPLFLAAVLVITFSPITPRVVALLRGSRTLAALAMTFGVVLLVLVPLTLLVALMASEASHFHDRVEEIRSGGSEHREAIMHWFQSHWLALQARYPLLASIDLSR
jgi:predicted PurR-regulated permease PerM